MDDQTPDSATPASTEAGSLIVVGVGASAGGLEAFTDLLRNLPANTGMAFVLVQHLDPHHESALPELLSGITRMPVLQVREDTPLQPDHVYVIPPNSVMLVRNRMLTLQARPVTPERLRPIDAFFHSLAGEFRFNAVGVVLSGTASDGTLGLKSIKAEGGITFAQNQTAKFDSMPRNAIAAGVVDFVLPPRRIAEELVALGHRTLDAAAAHNHALDHGDTLQRLLLLLRGSTGVDFTQYKQPTILRRLNRRLVLRKSDSLEDYLNLLQREPGEAEALFNDLLINVTDFFRGPEVFEAAQRLVFPSIVRDRKQTESIRAWIPGCSSGEEIYSLAIALLEYLESEDLSYTIQMFGTDVSDSNIARARAGIYSESAVVNVSPERLRRFFVRTESGYQISTAVREMCIFSRHNAGKDPPLSRMDLISCRNLLIYLSPSLQRRIVAMFGYALQPGGCLILGPSETLGALSEYFVPFDEPHKLYCRKPEISRDVFNLSEVADEHSLGRAARPDAPQSLETSAGGPRLQRSLDPVALWQYGPAGVVADESLKIVEYRGDAAEYLALPGMPLQAGLMSVVHPEMRSSLAAALEQARRTNVAVVAENVAVPGRPASVAITVVPVSLPGIPRHFLILFGRAAEPQLPAGIPAEPPSLAAQTIEQENAQLRQELKTNREYLQSVIEELRSANEEAQSANEELQSTNEEIQTSKEELQSSNEELNTINAEMQSRNVELAQANNDLINLLGSMNMPIVMTGGDLRIRRFTPMAERVLRLIPADVGRSIADLKPRIDVPNLEEILQRVLDTLQPHEQEVKDREGRLYLLRVRPYRTADNRIDGTVLQMLDVTDLRRSLEEAKHARDYAEAIVNTVREPLVVLDENLAIQNANRAFYDALDLAPSAAPGQSIFQVGRERFDSPTLRALFHQLHAGSAPISDVEMAYQSPNGEARTLTLNARHLQTPDRKQLILVAFEDITERQRAAQARYRRLFESARDGIVLVDAETGEIVDVNPFTEQLLGYPREALLHRKFWEIESVRNLPRMRGAVQQIRERGVIRFDDLALRTRDGRGLHAEVIGNVYSEGPRRAIQFNIRDVSERKRFERELQETQKREGLGLLAGGIAHDFNNLLTGILGNASLAYSETPVENPTRIRLREILQAGERAAYLTRQMLAYAGRGRFVTAAIDLGDLIREIAPLVRTSIPKTVELKLDLAPDLPPIEADPAQIQQVVMNLAINGAEAIGEGAAGKVEVRTSLREIPAGEPAPGTYLQLEVTDTGSGMDEAVRERIFDPFFTTKFTGRGLGLAAVQGIVKGHGGTIRVFSTPGEGTSFLILLPAKSRGTAGARAEPAAARAFPQGSVALVIDDEETIRSLANNVLARAGMRVLTAQNGRAGLELFREHNAMLSVVVLDLSMPAMGGEEALAQIKRINPGVPVVLSSGFDESEAARKFASLKPSRFLQKPYTAERLVEAIAASLAGPDSPPVPPKGN